MKQHTVNSAICCKCACRATWLAVLLSILAQECRNSTYLTHYNWCEPICQDGSELRFDLLAKVVSFGDPRDEPVGCICDLRLVPQGCWRYRPQLRGAAHHNFFAAIAWIFLGRKHHDEFGMLEESLIESIFFFKNILNIIKRAFNLGHCKALQWILHCPLSWVNLLLRLLHKAGRCVHGLATNARQRIIAPSVP